MGFPDDTVVKKLPANAGDTGDARDTGDPWVVKIPGEGNGNPFQYSCLENSMDRGAMGYSPWGCTELDTTEHTRRVNAHELCEKWSGTFTERET